MIPSQVLMGMSLYMQVYAYQSKCTEHYGIDCITGGGTISTVTPEQVNLCVISPASCYL